MILSFASWGQDEYYRFTHNELYQFVERQKDSFDVTIPIEERIPLFTRSLASTNWGTVWHQIQKNIDKLKARAKRPVKVYVFDTGAGFTNKKLQKAWDKARSRDYVNDGTSIDVQGHSTHVNGIIAADDPNIGIGAGLVQLGLLTVAPQEVLDDNGSGNFDTHINPAIAAANKEAIELIKQGYFIIYNFSLGGSGNTPLATDKLMKEAQDSGILVACASGNTYGQGVNAPANSKYVYAVAALQQDNTQVIRAPYSTYGKEVFAAAAGSNVWSTLPDDKEAALSGTSMATPTFVGLCAWIASINPSLNAAQVVDLAIKVMQDVAPAGKDIYTGYGSIMGDLILDNEPTDPGNPNPDPNPEPPAVYKARTVSIPIRNYYDNILFKSTTDGAYRYMSVGGIVVEYKTTKSAELASQEINALADNFFTRRGFILPQDQTDLDFTAAWASYFFRLLAKNSGYDVNIAEMWAAEGLSDDRTLVYYTKDYPVGSKVLEKQFVKTRAAKKMQRRGEIATLNWN